MAGFISEPLDFVSVPSLQIIILALVWLGPSFFFADI